MPSPALRATSPRGGRQGDCESKKIAKTPWLSLWESCPGGTERAQTALVLIFFPISGRNVDVYPLYDERVSRTFLSLPHSGNDCGKSKKTSGSCRGLGTEAPNVPINKKDRRSGLMNYREERMRTTLSRASCSSRNSETERSSACV